MKILKKSLFVVLIIYSIFLSSCYKKARYTFCNSIYNYTELHDEEFNAYDVNSFSITLNEISNEKYAEANKINVIKNKKDNKCYDMIIKLSIKGIDDVNISSEEINGLTDRADAYYFNITFLSESLNKTIKCELYFYERYDSDDIKVKVIELSRHTENGYINIAKFKA